MRIPDGWTSSSLEDSHDHGRRGLPQECWTNQKSHYSRGFEKTAFGFLPVIPMIAFHWASGSRGMETKPQVFIRLQDHKYAIDTFCWLAYMNKADISHTG